MLYERALTQLINSLDTDTSSSTYQSPDGIVRFVADVLMGTPTDYQAEILHDFVLYRRIAVRAPHGAGKTALSAWITLWALGTFFEDVKVITTAGAWQQLIHFTWPEIRKWAGHANWRMVNIIMRRNKELLDQNIKLANGKEAFAVASANPGFIEGAHARRLVYVFDEAKLIPDATWDAAEGAFASAGEDTDFEAYAIAISTPGNTSGRFYDICKRKPGFEDWRTRHVTLEECIRAGRISRNWAEQRKKQWGENDSRYHNRVLAEFFSSGEDVIVPLAWVEAANERYRVLTEAGIQLQGRSSYGVDPAYKGDDQTTIAHITGRLLQMIIAHNKETTMNTVGRVVSMITKDTPVAVDTIGVGAGVYDRLVELGYNQSVSVNVSEKTEMRGMGGQTFFNLRAAIWWFMREALDPEGPAPMAIPPIDELTNDLTAPTYWYNSKGEICVESKDELRKRLGRSTDFADAFGLALYAGRYEPLIMV
jgi:hypothetical protein